MSGSATRRTLTSVPRDSTIVRTYRAQVVLERVIKTCDRSCGWQRDRRSARTRSEQARDTGRLGSPSERESHESCYASCSCARRPNVERDRDVCVGVGVGGLARAGAAPRRPSGRHADVGAAEFLVAERWPRCRPSRTPCRDRDSWDDADHVNRAAELRRALARGPTYRACSPRSE